MVTDSNALFQFVEGLKPHIRKYVLLAQPTNVSEAMMAAERSEVAHNFSFSGKAKFAFQKNHF